MNTEHEAPVKKTSAFKQCIYILTILAILYTAYLAQDLLLLLLVVGLTSLLLSPGMRVLEKLYIPRVLGATILLCAIVIPTGIFTAQLQEPISRWAKALPKLSTQVTEQIQAFDNAIEVNTMPKAPLAPPKEIPKKKWFGWFDSDPETEPKIEMIKPPEESGVIQTRIKESIFSVAREFVVSAPFVLIQVLTTLVLILFTLVYSPALFKHYVSLFVKEEKQKRVHFLALNAQKQLSRYILTVSVVNLGLGIAAFGVLKALGFQDAILIGSIVGLMNFIPYVGPLIALTFITIGGYVQWGADINLLFCLGGVLALNVIESQFVTPMVLAQKMRINPFVIILWLLFCSWMWGLIGVLIAVPLIVCIKLLLRQFESTKKWVALLAT